MILVYRTIYNLLLQGCVYVFLSLRDLKFWCIIKKSTLKLYVEIYCASVNRDPLERWDFVDVGVIQRDLQKHSSLPLTYEYLKQLHCSISLK